MLQTPAHDYVFNAKRAPESACFAIERRSAEFDYKVKFSVAVDRRSLCPAHVVDAVGGAIGEQARMPALLTALTLSVAFREQRGLKPCGTAEIRKRAEPESCTRRVDSNDHVGAADAVARQHGVKQRIVEQLAE